METQHRTNSSLLYLKHNPTVSIRIQEEKKKKQLQVLDDKVKHLIAHKKAQHLTFILNYWHQMQVGFLSSSLNQANKNKYVALDFSFRSAWRFAIVIVQQHSTIFHSVKGPTENQGIKIRAQRILQRRGPSAHQPYWSWSLDSWDSVSMYVQYAFIPLGAINNTQLAFRHLPCSSVCLRDEWTTDERRRV